MSDSLDRARLAIDAAHAADPERTADGHAAELRYADLLEKWLGQLIPAPSTALRLAARCQHLERWTIPRASFPLDRVGYLQWRRSVHVRQGARARELLLSADCDAELSQRVEQLVAKAAPKGDADGQALEDAACLVFLADELTDFASTHPDYTREKFIDIIRKTWRKMSPDAHRLALTIALPPALSEMVHAAVSS